MSIVPFVGDAVGKGGKLVKAGVKYGDEIVDGAKAIAKNADEVIDAGKGVGKYGDIVDSWYKATFNLLDEAMKYHLRKH